MDRQDRLKTTEDRLKTTKTTEDRLDRLRRHRQQTTNTIMTERQSDRQTDRQTDTYSRQHNHDNSRQHNHDTPDNIQLQTTYISRQHTSPDNIHLQTTHTLRYFTSTDLRTPTRTLPSAARIIVHRPIAAVISQPTTDAALPRPSHTWSGGCEGRRGQDCFRPDRRPATAFSLLLKES